VDPGSWAVLIAILAVGLTVFFSMTNLALRHVSWSKLEEAFSRKGGVSHLEFYRDRIAHLISSTAIFRLLVNLTFLMCILYLFLPEKSAQSAKLFFPLLRSFFLSGLVLVIFSIGLPHAWAKYGGTAFLAHGYLILKFFDGISRPVTFVLHLLEPPIRRLAGLSRQGQNGRIEEKHEELLDVVGAGEKEGVVDEEEREMIESVLEFRDTTVSEIMTPRTEIVGLPAEAALCEVKETIVQAGHSRYPVYEESIDHIIGMLYAKDLLQDLDTDQGGPDAGIRNRIRVPYFVPASKTLRDVLHDFQNQKVHLAVVLDEYGGTAGVVTIEDVLEEIVGEITDEHEPPQAEPLKQMDENTIEVDARYEVDELNDECDLDIPEEEGYETVGGFAFSRLGYIPQTGEEFDHENLHFTILDAGQRKINRIRIQKKPKEETNNHSKA
jgi:magnesium and cobalt exporter, CNNM family